LVRSTAHPMADPYRSAPAKPALGRRRPRARQLAWATAALWLFSVVRLVVAYEQNERVSFEPALAALLTAAPPVVLLCRAVREACVRSAEDVSRDSDPPSSG
jgi:hypothetical protein